MRRLRYTVMLGSLFFAAGQAFGQATVKDVIDTGSQVKDAIDCAKMMGKPSIGGAVSCAATALDLAPDRLSIEQARMAVACGTSGAAIASLGTLHNTCITTGIAGGIRGSVVGPKGAAVGAVGGCIVGVGAQLAGTALAAYECQQATDAVKQAARAQSSAAETITQSTTTIQKSQAVQQDCITNCHRATGGIGPVKFENSVKDINGMIQSSKQYADWARGEAVSQQEQRDRSASRDRIDHDRGPRDFGPRDSGPKDKGPKDTGPKDTGPKDKGPKDTGPKDRGPRDTGPKDRGPRDGPSCDPGDKDCGPGRLVG